MGSQVKQYFNLTQESINIYSSTVNTYQTGNQQGGASYCTLDGKFKSWFILVQGRNICLTLIKSTYKNNIIKVINTLESLIDSYNIINCINAHVLAMSSCV